MMHHFFGISTRKAEKIYSTSALVAFVVIAAVPLFWHLDKKPVRLWDESRLAMNAYEMDRNHNFLVTHFEGEPDLWNTKPPLMIWLQVFTIKLIGLNELALRLPSAVAALFTIVLLLWFSKLYTGNFLTGMIASLVLVTTNGYIEDHASRTGDYDTLLTLFTTLCCLSFILHIELKKNVFLHIFFFALTLAVLTKSIQGLLFLPAIALFAVVRKQLSYILGNKWLYINTAVFLLVIAAYYLLRERSNPGYLQAVWENELGGRYFSVLEENQHGNWYFVRQLKELLLLGWFWVVPCAIVAGLSFLRGHAYTLIVYCTLLSLSYLLLISLSQTKLWWYTVPLFPLFGLLIGGVLYFLLEKLKERINPGVIKKTATPAILILVFIFPYIQIGRKVNNPLEYKWDKGLYSISYLLQEAVRGKISLDNHFIAYKDYNTHLLFYVRSLNDRSQKIDFKDPETLNAGDLVIASEPNVKDFIQQKFRYEIVRHYDEARIFRIVEKIADTSF
jgi:4-amino-4-deoxy-L-arabinose transferase-like glycosyltransferase